MPERLFNYRPDGNTISTNDGDKKIALIRRGPKGIVSIVVGIGPVVIWNADNADAHVGDSEGDLIQKTIDVLNA
jgi:hypothetical protein